MKHYEKQGMQLLESVGLPLLITALLWYPQTASADPPGYSFRLIASLGDSAPGGGTFVNDFEPSAIQNGGDNLAFVADASTGGECVFVVRHGQILQGIVENPCSRSITRGCPQRSGAV